MTRIDFTIPGIPKPGGSKRGFYSQKLKRVLIVDACNNEDWKTNCTFFARQYHAEAPLTGALRLTITFVMPRPKSHFHGNGTLRAKAPHYHTNAPDATKLTRSTEDAITSVIWADDKQIAVQHIQKIYGDRPGAHVIVETLDPPTNNPNPNAQPAASAPLFASETT